MCFICAYIYVAVHLVLVGLTAGWLAAGRRNPGKFQKF